MVKSTSKPTAWPWGPPLSPVLANLFMEEFEEKAIIEATHPPKF